MSRVKTVTAAQLARTIKALELSGAHVCGARVHPDGSVSLLTGQPSEPLPSAESGSWVDFLGETSAHHA